MVTFSRWWVDLVLFTAFLLLAVLAFALTFSFPRPLLPGYPGSAMFPQLVLGTMGAMALLGIVRTVARRADLSPQIVNVPLFPFALAILSLCVVAALLEVAGMEIAVFMFVAGALWLRTRKIGVPALAGVLSVIVVYALFVQALSVHLPLLFLPRYL